MSDLTFGLVRGIRLHCNVPGELIDSYARHTCRIWAQNGCPVVRVDGFTDGKFAWTMVQRVCSDGWRVPMVSGDHRMERGRYYRMRYHYYRMRLGTWILREDENFFKTKPSVSFRSQIPPNCKDQIILRER